MHPGTDTIAAISTAPGRGGVGIVRVSGPGVKAIAETLLGRVPEPRRAGLHDFTDEAGAPIDQGLALYFPAPHSYTGEDVLELHGHGGPVVMDLLLQRLLGLGARLATAGEFTQRAFLNDKLDLAQAEAIADLIDSGSAQAARAALRSLQGEFSRAGARTFRACAGTAHVDRGRDRLPGRRNRLPRRPRARRADGRPATPLRRTRRDGAARGPAAGMG